MATIVGTSANNTLTGGAARDLIYGRDGNDTLYGLGSGDYLSGENGNDILYGGDGDDQLDGGAGADVLRGDAGNDYLNGMDGGDTLESGAGRDTLRADAGNDLLRLTGDGQKLVNGGEGDDTIQVYARAMHTATDFSSVLSGDGGFDTMRFGGQAYVDGEAVRTTVVSQPANDPDSYTLDYRSLHHTDHAADLVFVEKFDLRALPGNAELNLMPWAGGEVDFALTAGNDRVTVDMRHGTDFSVIDLEAFTPGRDVLRLTGGDVVRSDVAVTHDTAGTVLTVDHGLEIHLAGVANMNYGTDWLLV